MISHAPATEHLPPATLAHARSLRDDLQALLSREREATVEFILALAAFDARRGWEPLGHASLFAFLHRELGLSKGAAFLRLSATRLLPRHPEVEAGLRSGRLCLSAVGELARVLTPSNSAQVLPLFLGCSAREAREVAAALVPREDPPSRELVTRLPLVSLSRPVASADVGVAPDVRAVAPGYAEASPGVDGPSTPDGRTDRAAGAEAAQAEVEVGSLGLDRPAASTVRAHELAPTQAARGVPTAECEPLNADLRRLHLTVSLRLLSKLSSARDALSHARPGATTEQVLEYALDLLLETVARRRGMVKRGRRSAPGRRASGSARRIGRAASTAGSSAAAAPAGKAPPTSRTTTAASDPTPASKTTAASDPTPASKTTAASAPTPASKVKAVSEAAPAGVDVPPVAVGPAVEQESGVQERKPDSRAPARAGRGVPAKVRREVWQRDGGRCQFPLDAGGTCGSTIRVEFDHVVPVALGGPSTPGNLRLLCARHNRYAARLALGEAVMATTARRRRGRSSE